MLSTNFRLFLRFAKTILESLIRITIFLKNEVDYLPWFLKKCFISNLHHKHISKSIVFLVSTFNLSISTLTLSHLYMKMSLYSFHVLLYYDVTVNTLTFSVLWRWNFLSCMTLLWRYNEQYVLTVNPTPQMSRALNIYVGSYRPIPPNLGSPRSIPSYFGYTMFSAILRIHWRITTCLPSLINWSTVPAKYCPF